MAENTRFKELNAELRRVAEQGEKNYAELQTQIKQAEVDNVQRFERIEHSLKSTEANVARIIAVLEKQPVGSPSSFSGDLNGSPTPQPNQQRQPFQVRSIKLDFPKFDGKNVVGWIFKAQQFFDYYNTPDAERLTIASVHLDHDIVPWFQMMQRVNPFHHGSSSLEL